MRRLLATLCVLLQCALASALNGLFFSADRLSCSMVNAIVQDAHGLVWIGSEHGLDSFDGYTFTPHSLVMPDHPRPTVVAALYVDADGRLWVGTAHGLLLYDYASDAFAPVTFPDGIEPRVSQLLQLRDGRIVAGTSGYGLYAIDTDSLAAMPVTDMAPADDDDYFNHIFQSADGTFWKSGADERIVRHSTSGRNTTLTTGCGSVVSFVERDGQALALCSRALLDTDGRQLLDDAGDASAHFNVATADEQGNIYIGTRAHGLLWIPKGERAVRRLPVRTQGTDITSATIEALCLDRHGNLWVGCQQQGLLLVPLRHRPLFQTWNPDPGAVAGSPVVGLTGGEDGLTYGVVPGSGIYGFSPEGIVSSHPSTPADAESLCRDAEGNYWLGTTAALYRLGTSTATCSLVCPLPGYRVNAIADVGHGQLAVSTFSEGMAIVDKQAGHVVRQLTMHATDTVGRGRLVNDWIYAFATDQRGCLWIGTASGVSCYDAEHDRFVPFVHDDAIDREACTALCVLHSGDVLMGLERGLYRWNSEHGLQPEAGTEALRGRAISYITEDSRHEVWISTNDGIWHWTPQSSTLTSYVGATSMRTREFVRGAGLQTADGRILLGTSQGITLFHPDSLRRHRHSDGEVHLTAFVVNVKHANATSVSNGRKIMQEALCESRLFRLSYLDASFQMAFSLLTFADDADVSFDYRFRGEERWQSTPRGSNIVSFSHLAPGDYILEVRARLADAYTPVAEYTLEILPPWWRSGWAYAIYVLLLCALLALATVAYNRHLRHQHDKEKLHLLMNAMGADDEPLSAEDMRRAIHSYVQSRQHKRGTFGDVAAMADRVEVPAQRGNDEALMDRIMQSINHHLGDSDFSVEQLCTEAAISRAHLHRKMKELTGLSVTEFIRNIRLEQAARLLREQKLNVTQVAYSVGFASLGYFTTVFRKHFGVTPREYVKSEK